MEITVNFLENLKLEAKFDDFTVIADQPIRYKGDGSAPGPFDYFLASSVLCAAYFVRLYCESRQIPIDDIRLSQNNIIDPENRYKQTFQILVALPEDLPEKHREGILRSVERCTVKRVVQNCPEFIIETVNSLETNTNLVYESDSGPDASTVVLGKDLPLEQTIANMTDLLASIGIKIEISSWRNIVPNVWSVHIRDAASPMCFTNGKGASRDSAICSALGEYLERASCNFFYNDHFFGEDVSSRSFVHYPNEKWFKAGPNDSLPMGLMDETCLDIYNPDNELKASNLIDANSGRIERGICALPFERQSDKQTVYIPANLIGNLFVSNGMSAGNTLNEAKVQCLSEIFERAVKKQIIEQELSLPDVPKSILEKYPTIVTGINELEEKGFPILIKDASLGGQFPVMCVTLMNPRTGGVFASFGAHPKFEVALERSLTELLQGRSFEGLNDLPPATFNSLAVSEPSNFIEHFIDSSGIISWRFFSDKNDYDFCEWDFSGTTEQENDYLMNILHELNKEVYVSIHEDLGAKACRILVPGYSEIYPVDDLIWDNSNKALDFREDILNLHNIDSRELASLVERLEESQLDNSTIISALIGIEFDENTPWGKLDIGELKILIYLALKEYENANDLIFDFINFNDNTVARRLFYQALNAALDVTIDQDEELSNYLSSMTRMYGSETMEAVVGSISGEVRFYGLTKTSMKLEGLDKHLRLIESYKKLHQARATIVQQSLV